MHGRVEEIDAKVFHGLLVQHLGRDHGVSPRVHKHHDLVVPLEHVSDLFEGDLVQVLLGLLRAGLALDADEVLLQRHGAEGGVKVKETLVPVDLEEVGHINVVGERGTQTDDADQRLGAFHLALRSGNERLQHSTAFVVKHVNLIDDEEADLLHQLGVAGALSRDDVPFLRGRDDDLRLDDLGLGQVHVSGELAALDAKPGQSLAELLGDFRRERLHRGDVDDLEVLRVDCKVCGGRVLDGIGRAVVADGLQDGEHGGVRFALTSGRADEHVLVRPVCHRMHQTLHAVERLVPLEGPAAEAIHVGYLDQLLAGAQDALLSRRNGVLFVLFELQPLTPRGERVLLARVAERVPGIVRLVDVGVLNLLGHGRSEGRILVLVVLASQRLLALGFGQQSPSRLLVPL
ncbi:hypothetical protein CCHR01_00028 [Colletotrichum chrysophilum]|uniref:Uncharacterized protein n=1 Tax=Colletotrichum chrysophilum TaxID=1836956 RepID=A0AAD9B0H5_9PEZI|nr:hypothetical protein CCHR01_00028 [Colletotrichum chrysophilum]